MTGPNTPETEQDAVLVQDRRRFRALQSLTAQCKPQTSVTKKRPNESLPSTPSFRPLSAQQEFNEENEDLAIAREIKDT
jgi:hypothetical protein